MVKYHHIGIARSYGHGFKPVKLPEIVCRDGFIVKDCVRGGTSGAIYCLWQIGDDYGDDSVQGMNYWLWLQIKIVKNPQ